MLKVIAVTCTSITMIELTLWHSYLLHCIFCSYCKIPLLMSMPIVSLFPILTFLLISGKLPVQTEEKCQPFIYNA